MEPDKTIMIVDDDKDNRSILAELLSRDGYKTLQADSADSCLALLKESQPDLIVMDVMMPDMTGTDLCLAIKKDERYINLSIILVSGVKISPEDRAFGLEIGADDYISRPFQKRELLARIRSILRIRESLDIQRKNQPYNAFSHQHTTQTSSAYGQARIKEVYPGEFEKLGKIYIDLMLESIERRLYKNEIDMSPETKYLAQQLGFLKAAARDVIDIHSMAIEALPEQETAVQSFYVKEESRILLVELMGHLLNYYRNIH